MAPAVVLHNPPIPPVGFLYLPALQEIRLNKHDSPPGERTKQVLEISSEAEIAYRQWRHCQKISIQISLQDSPPREKGFTELAYICLAGVVPH